MSTDGGMPESPNFFPPRSRHVSRLLPNAASIQTSVPPADALTSDPSFRTGTGSPSAFPVFGETRNAHSPGIRPFV